MAIECLEQDLIVWHHPPIVLRPVQRFDALAVDVRSTPVRWVSFLTPFGLRAELLGVVLGTHTRTHARTARIGSTARTMHHATFNDVT